MSDSQETREQAQRYEYCPDEYCPGVYSVLLGVYRPGMNPDDSGDWVTYTDYAALRQHLAKAQADKDSLYTANVRLVKVYDAIVGTPCEQIRHAQEVESLTQQLTEVRQKLAQDALTARTTQERSHA